MKEIKHEVITQGTPRLENMPKEVFNVFCTSLLSLVEDFYSQKNCNLDSEKTQNTNNE